MAGIVAWLIDLSGIGTNEAIADLGLIAALDQIGPDANALLVVVGQTRWTLVLGRFAVPAGEEHPTVGCVWEEAVEARTVGR